jgi:hypothetical protein
LKAGRILIRGGASAFDCTVRDMSCSGAKLEIAVPMPVPANFVLELSVDADVRHVRCCTMWQKGTTLGVAFKERGIVMGSAADVGEVVRDRREGAATA